MKIIDRYVGTAVLASTALVATVVLGLATFLSVLEELDDVGRGSYDLQAAFTYVLLILPNLTLEVFAMVVLLGSLLGLGLLANHHELVVLRAAGVSVRRILWAVLKVGVLLMAAVAALGEFVAPDAIQLAKELRHAAKYERVVFSSEQGFWVRDGRANVNIRQVLPGARLAGVLIYRFGSAHRLESVTHAASAAFADGRWVLRDVRRSRFGADRVTTERVAAAPWPAVLDPELLDVVLIDPKILSGRDLRRYIGFLRNHRLDAHRYEIAFWAKVAFPLTALLMVFLAVPFVLGPLRTVSIARRIVTGAMIGIGFALANKAVGQLGLVYRLDPVLCAFFPMLAFFGAGLWGLSRLR